MSPLKITELSLPGVLLIEPRLSKDDRGFFIETYNEKVFFESGITTKFVQDNLSRSKRGVLRGLHLQKPPFVQDKLVRCVEGEVFDVAADCDPSSSTYGQHVAVTLKPDEGIMLFVPGKYAHGFYVISEQAVFEYKVSNFYSKEATDGVMWNDPVLKINWPIQEPTLSPQDMNWPLLKK